MPKLRICYPYISWQVMNVNVSDEVASLVMNMSLEQQVAYIEELLKKHKVKHQPHSLESALETGYASIKRAE